VLEHFARVLLSYRAKDYEAKCAAKHSAQNMARYSGLIGIPLKIEARERVATFLRRLDARPCTGKSSYFSSCEAVEVNEWQWKSNL